MSRYVNIAAPLFESERYRGKNNASAMVLRELREKMNRLAGTSVDLLVFSEGVEAVGMSMDDAETLDHPGTYLNLFMDFARKEKCHVAGSIKLREKDKVYNALVFVDATGKVVGAYRKTFLTLGELELGLTPGPGAETVDTAIGRLGGMICFDLNFGELRQEYARLKPDILLFASMYHGGLMQATWAYECRSFFVSALPFHGGGILDPFGRTMACTDCYSSVARAKVNLDRVMVHLDFNRDKFPDIEKKYRDDIRIDTPANIGPALIYSETEQRTAMDIVREFDLELVDDYLQRSSHANAERRNEKDR